MMRRSIVLQKPIRLITGRLRVPQTKITKLKHPTLPALIDSLPKPADYSDTPEDRTTWKHKNGRGMKFFRTDWRFPEPTYFTITRYRPATQNQRPKAWGTLTWRGVEYPKERVVKRIFTPSWRYIRENDWPPAGFETAQDRLFIASQEAAKAAEEATEAAAAAEEAEKEENATEASA